MGMKMLHRDRIHGGWMLLLVGVLTYGMAGCGESDVPEPPEEVEPEPEPEPEPERRPLLQPPRSNELALTLQVERSMERSIVFGNVGDAALNWSVATNVPWLSVQPSEGVIAPLGEAEVDVTVACPAEAGRYEGRLTLASDDAVRPSVRVAVVLTCTPFPVGSLEVRTTGLPTELVPVYRLRPADPASELEEREIPSDFLVSGIRPGDWVLEVPAVTSLDDVTRWEPAADEIPVEIIANEAQLARATYARIDGAVEVRVDAPADMPAPRIRVRGPESFDARVDETARFDRAAPGVYRLEATGVLGADELSVWRPSVDEEAQTLRSGEEATFEVSYALSLGSIAVGVQGLPDGLVPSIEVEGPEGFSTTLAGGDVLTDLRPGTWTFVASEVLSSDGLEVWAPARAERVVVLASETSRTVDFVYAAGRGSLRVDVLDLPFGLAGNVAVTGPGGFSEPIGASRTFRDLRAGAYRVEAESVPVPGTLRRFEPDISGVDVEVTSGGEATATVRYSERLSTLRVDVAGLPAGVPASVTVSGPNGFRAALAGSQLLAGIVPGAYAIRSSDVVVAGTGTRWRPLDPEIRIELEPGDEVDSRVEYAPVSTTLVLQVRGLTAPDQAILSVTTPSGEVLLPPADLGSANWNLTELDPGEYTIRAENIASGDGITTFRPLFAIRTIDLRSDELRTLVVEYEPVPGSVQVAFTTVPEGFTGRFALSGPGGFNRTTEGSATVTNLRPGNYTLNVLDISTVDGGSRWSADAAAEVVEVRSNETVSRSFAYALVRGALQIDVLGVPEGQTPSLRVFGPAGFDRTTEGNETFTDLIPGAYTVQANDLRLDGSPVVLTPIVRNTAATVRSGQQAIAEVVYRGEPGTVSVSVSGLPSGLDSDVELITPDNTRRTLTSGFQVFENADPGVYEIRANDVSRVVDGRQQIYRAVNPGALDEYREDETGVSLLFTLQSGIPAFYSVSYALQPGTLSVQVQDLPVGLDPSITVTGPAFSRTLLRSNSVSDGMWVSTVAPAEYQLTAPDVSDVAMGRIYRARGDMVVSASVSSRATSTTTIRYDVVDGSYAVRLGGVSIGGSDVAEYQVWPADGGTCSATPPIGTPFLTREIDEDGRTDASALAPGLWCVLPEEYLLLDDVYAQRANETPIPFVVTSEAETVVDLRYRIATSRLEVEIIGVEDTRANAVDFTEVTFADEDPPPIWIEVYRRHDGEDETTPTLTGFFQIVTDLPFGEWSVRFRSSPSRQVTVLPPPPVEDDDEDEESEPIQVWLPGAFPLGSPDFLVTSASDVAPLSVSVAFELYAGPLSFTETGAPVGFSADWQIEFLHPWTLGGTCDVDTSYDPSEDSIDRSELLGTYELETEAVLLQDVLPRGCIRYRVPDITLVDDSVYTSSLADWTYLVLQPDAAPTEFNVTFTPPPPVGDGGGDGGT